MYHETKRLLKIEVWMRRLSWYYLVSAALGVFITLYNSIAIWVNPEAMGYFGEYNNTWLKLLAVFTNFKSLAVSIFVYFVLQGVAILIRYLLAMEDRIQGNIPQS